MRQSRRQTRRNADFNSGSLFNYSLRRVKKFPSSVAAFKFHLQCQKHETEHEKFGFFCLIQVLFHVLLKILHFRYLCCAEIYVLRSRHFELLMLFCVTKRFSFSLLRGLKTWMGSHIFVLWCQVVWQFAKVFSRWSGFWLLQALAIFMFVCNYGINQEILKYLTCNETEYLLMFKEFPS